MENENIMYFPANNPLKATKALVVYESDEPEGSSRDINVVDCFISLHEIDQQGNLLAGMPLTRKSLQQIAYLALPGLSEACYLPEEMLLYSPGHMMAWWNKAASRNLFFTKATGIKSGCYPVPALLFLVRDKTLHVWALNKNKRPVPNTKVYHAPFNNIYDGGSCCMGNVSLPEAISPETIRQWEECFFGGAANNELPPKLKTKDPKSLWKSLAGKEQFPVRELVPYTTLENIINPLSKIYR